MRPRVSILYILILWTKLAHGLASAPHLLVTHLLQLLPAADHIAVIKEEDDGNQQCDGKEDEAETAAGQGIELGLYELAQGEHLL